MAGRELPHREALQQDDLRLIYKDKPVSLAAALCSVWPTKLNWEHTQDGKQVSVGLHGIAAAIMFLRRMYAFSLESDLFSVKPTLLMKLAWRKEPFHEEGEPGLLQALSQELGFAISAGEGPTLLEILSHDSMANVWGDPSMALINTNLIKMENGQPDTVVQLELPSGEWKEWGLLTVREDLGDQQAKFFNSLIGMKGSKYKMLCNFPLFIRAHYQTGRTGLKKPQSFSTLRSFQLRASVLVDGTNTKEHEQSYVLIACFLNPDENNKVGELRIYTKYGRPIMPKNAPAPGEQHLYDPDAERRLCDPVMDCILLYGKVDSLKEHPQCDELALNSVRRAFSMPSSQILRNSAESARANPSTPIDVPQPQSGDISTTYPVQSRLSQGQQQQLESRITELDLTIQNLRNAAASTEQYKDALATQPETAAQKIRRLREERNEALAELEEAKAEVAALKGRIFTISDATESYTELNEELNQIVQSLREQNTQQAQDRRDEDLVDALLKRIQSINAVAHKVNEAHRELFRENKSLRQSETKLKRKLASYESQLASSEPQPTNRELEKQLKSANKRARHAHNSKSK
ncbi:hypothetical protein F4860DRAFT_513703 [Xylaria cubensis]|nr:hypothetical protein F4860DRAFT_513703 [Xylaria cubensis]